VYILEQNRFFNLKPLDVDLFIKHNNLKEVTNPIFFTSSAPTSDGLLSNDIFGISKDERANTFAYISLGKGPYISPIMYKTMVKLDSKISALVHGTKNFSINKSGELVEDEENGNTGLKFLKDNFEKIKFKDNGSDSRKFKINFLNKFKDKIFIENMIVIPAYYRDINTDTGNRQGVGEINKMYDSLIIAANSLRDTQDYGLTLSDAVRGRIQDILVEIFDWLMKEPNTAGKRGILRRANLSKTTDYSSRLVLSAPNLKVEHIEDMMSDVDHTAIPLASVIVNFFPYMMFYIRRFFENEFANDNERIAITKDKKSLTSVSLPDYRMVFSDTRIKEELDRFVHGYADRFRIIKIPVDKSISKSNNVGMELKGSVYTSAESYHNKETNESKMLNRLMTWCDLIYMAAVEVTADKMVLITRYPIDSCYNQFPTKINVSSTKETEPIEIEGKFYPHYPKIRQEDIGKNTSNLFIDTANISNVYLGSIGGDYDGDQISCKSVFSIEANAELRKQLNSKNHFIALNGKDIMETTNEGAMALYSLTMNLNKDEKIFTDPKF
jgi:hypothetical protein